MRYFVATTRLMGLRSYRYSFKQDGALNKNKHGKNLHEITKQNGMENINPAGRKKNVTASGLFTVYYSRA
jgi:hypothetical protein